MTTNDLFTPNQHGFSSGISCYSLQLTPGQKSLEENYAIGIIYFDFAKTSDSVPHKHLLVKPESYGNRLGWLRSFLFGGRQKVVVS